MIFCDMNHSVRVEILENKNETQQHDLGYYKMNAALLKILFYNIQVVFGNVIGHNISM